MPAYYYVKTGGTATGDAGRYATKQSGSFASLGAAGYYPTVTDAIAATTAPVGGDFILVSDAHSDAQSSNKYFTNPSTGKPFNVVCVSDAAIDSPRGASRGLEQVYGSTTDMHLQYGGYYEGMHLKTDDNIQITQSYGAVFRDCILEFTGSADALYLLDGNEARLYDCELRAASTNSCITASGGARVIMRGGSMTNTAGADGINYAGATNGGMFFDFAGVDLTGITGNLISGVGNSGAADDLIEVRIDRCKLAAGVGLGSSEPLANNTHRILVTRSSSVGSDAEHQYSLTTNAGTVVDDSNIYRADDEPFTDSGEIVSLKAVTNSNCGHGRPLWFEFPWLRWVAASQPSSDTMRFYIACSEPLDNADVWVDVIYSDGTNKHTPASVSSRGFILGGAALSADGVSDWRNGAGELVGFNEYCVDVPIISGADGYPSAIVNISKPDATIYIASEYGVV